MRDWRGDEEAYDEARMDRFYDEPERERRRPRPDDVLTDRELQAEYGTLPWWKR